MKSISSSRKQVLSWAISAGLVLAPAVWPHMAKAQQSGDASAQPATASQKPNWGPAGPPPDAQNGQLPAQPADDQATASARAAAPVPEQQPERPVAQQQAARQPGQTAQQPGQAGQWGPAGPPPDVQNGEIPPPPPDDDQDSGAQNQGPSNPPQYPGYSSQDQGQQQYPYANQGQYASQAPPPPPSGPVLIPAGTLFQVRTSEPLDTKKLHPGDYFQATVAQGIFQGRVLAVPRGAQVIGRVVDVKKPGDLKGGAGFTLQLVSLNLGGRSVPLATDTWSMNGPGKGGYTATNTVGTAMLGAVIGAIAGGGPGAAIGAAAGTGVGLGASAATPGPRGVIPPEAPLTFHLVQATTVQPVSYQEARQLERSAAPARQMYGGQNGYPSGPGGPAYYYPGGPGPYAVPPPYPYPYVYGYPYRGYYRYRYWR